MIFRLGNSIYTKVQRNLRIGSLFVQHRRYSERRDVLKQELRDYVDQIEKHLFDYGAVKAYSTKIDEPEVYSQSESFSSNDAGWRFRWFRDSSSARDRLVVSSYWLFEKGYDAIRNYVSGDDLDPSYMSAFEALERFYAMKGMQFFSVPKPLIPRICKESSGTVYIQRWVQSRHFCSSLVVKSWD